MFEIFAYLWDIFYEFVSSLWFSKTLLFEKSGLSININDTRSIGEGAYSLVYKGTKQYDRSVQYAVKKMLVQSQEFDLMVQNEVESLSRFNHKNIIKLVDATRKHEGNMTVVYILLPYAKNGSLRDLLNDVAGAKKTRQPIIEVLSKFNEICNAFNVLHTFSPHSYVHQDIKPENILIGDDGSPLLTDFGSVRLADVTIRNRKEALNIADQAAQYCTASYRAPELYHPPNSCKLDTRTDVWGIGCLLFAWWFGHSPFECEFHGSSMRVVECTSLRVLSPIPRSSNPSPDDKLVLELVCWILQCEPSVRPFTSDIITRVEELVTVLWQMRRDGKSYSGV